ncbi:MAG: undecaprenyl-diphosphate phosphatase [Clostridia bacterium]
MNHYLQAILRGIVQGLTEFLPISSSGHLLLFSALGCWEESLFIDIMLHIATLLVVIIVFRKELLWIIKNPLSDETKFLIIATIPTAILAGVIRYFLEEEMVVLLPFCFLINGFILLSTKFINQDKRVMHSTLKSGIITGIMQGFACLSGISRSGSTFFATKLIGLDEEKSPSTIFLLSIPIILGSALVEGLGYHGGAQIDALELVLAMIFAFISGFLAIKTFVKLLKSGKIWYFSFYSFLIGIATFLIVNF